MRSIHDRAGVESWRRAQRTDPQFVRSFRSAFYRQGLADDAALRQFSSEVLDGARREFDLHSLALENRHDSRLDGASKLIFRTAAGLLLETVVLRVATGRTSLCISTQVGCAAKCDFCATGKMGIARNLSRDEILDQVVQANQLLRPEGRRARNLVFMGMGEPLHNEAELYQALDVLCDRQHFNYHPGRILISTVGIPDAMLRLVHRYPELRMAVSLHSARPHVRERLMPIAAHHRLEQLREALVEIGRIHQRPVMIEYLLLQDLTDTDDDQAALLSYLSGLDVHLNLIPFNPIEGAPHLAPSAPARRDAFSAALKAAGLRVTTRYSLGADVAAACGQLVRRENRARARDPLALWE